jgi:hypothetical protein
MCASIFKIKANRDDDTKTGTPHIYDLVISPSLPWSSLIILAVSSWQLVMHSSHAIFFDLLFLLCKRGKSLQELDSINIQVPTNYRVR